MSESFQEIILEDILFEKGEDATKSILSQFSCPKNSDVEDFFINKSIDFTKKGIASTTLIYSVTDESKALVGYYTLANKVLEIEPSMAISVTLKKKISKFKAPGSNGLIIPAILLAQFSKNFTNGSNQLITGDELMNLALSKIKEIQKSLGGKVLYLECEENEKLIRFYESHGFSRFNERDRDTKSDYLVQMIKYN